MYLLVLTPSEVLMFIFFSILTIVIWCLLIRWAVRADAVVKNQQAIIFFLILQCKNQGVPEQEIQHLKDHFGIK